ncbi:MAG: T9SS type A sorting domain-containing protein [bacterium]
MKKIVLVLILLFLFNQLDSYAELKLLGITEPGNIKADTGRFSDAYYVMTEAPVEVKALVYNDSDIDISNAKARVRIYQEKSDGSFDSKVFLEKEINYNIFKQDSLVIDFALASGEGEKFFPTTYYNILYNDSNFKYPDYFSNITWNVSPRYLIGVDLISSNGDIKYSQSRIVRFHLNVANKFLLSVENSMIDLNANSTTDQIAGRLNSDSLILNFKNMFKTDWSTYETQNYTIFDRKIWNENNINYNTYKYLFWADGDDKPISQNERELLIQYLESGKINEKKNLMICSQELARIHGKEGSQSDSIFLTKYLRSYNSPPGNPKGDGISCDGSMIKCVAINRDTEEYIKKTDNINDVPPYCGLVTLNKFGEGLVRSSANFFPPENYVSGELNAGTSVATLAGGLVYMAVDWRNFGNTKNLIIGGWNFFDKYGDYDAPITEYFIEENREDENYANFPGDSVKYSYRYVNQYLDYDYYKFDYLINVPIIIINAVNRRIDTIKTDENGFAYYNFKIPENLTPGLYQYFLKAEKVNQYDNFVVRELKYSILGNNSVCELKIQKYKTHKGVYKNFNWQITNGTILSYNSDSTEITVQWGESGEGKINLEMLKDGETKQLELNVTINPKPEKPFITLVDNKLISSSSFEYQWYFNNELIEGATDSIYEPQESGYYSVIVTNINGCASEMSEQFYFEKPINVEDRKLIFGLMEISPNPASEFIEIGIGVHGRQQTADGRQEVNIQIYNVYGECLTNLTPTLSKGEGVRINVSYLPNGTYFIRIGNEIQKFVVMR